MKIKKNFNKIPKDILNKISELKNDAITIFSFIKLDKNDILSGKYDHLNISIDNEQINYPESLLPNYLQGRYSRYNVEGRKIVLKKLPKIDKMFSFESPNFGDSSKGYHTTTLTRKVWQSKFIPPQFLHLIFELQESDDENYYIFKVYTNNIISKSSQTFENDLLFHCNLLQENIMTCDVTDSNIINEQYLNDLYVNWELLPPGTNNLDSNIKAFLSKKDYNNKTVYMHIKDRLLFFEELGAIKYIHGNNKFNSYKGALFSNDIVLLENYDYGNAAYIFKENWEELTKINRTELLNSHNGSIIRIIHTCNWKNNLTNALNSLTEL